MVITIDLGTVNVYLIKADGYILVDTGPYKNPKKLIKKLKRLNISPDEIKLIILTHSHSDHTNGLFALKKYSKAKVMIHKYELDCLNGVKDQKYDYTPWYMKPFMPIKNNPLNVKIDIIVEETFDLSEFGVEGMVYHSPGHTDGSLAILLKNGKAIIGDQLMKVSPFGKIGRPMIASDIKEIKKSIENLISKGARSFYISHGGEYNLQTIQKAIKDF